MSAVAVPATPVRAVVPQLALLEARRLVRHPVLLLAFGLYAAMLVDLFASEIRVVTAFEVVATGPSFAPGVPAILAGHLVATRDRRAGSSEWLGAAPARAQERVAALCLAALVPGLLALALNAGVVWQLERTGAFVQAPGLWHVLAAPMTVTGAVLFGVLVGSWFPARPAAVVGVVSLVAMNVWIANREDRWSVFGMAWDPVDWGPYDGSVWVGLHPGDPMWHVVYLLGLCALAAAGAVFRVADRRVALVPAGVVALAITVAGGIGQLA